MFKRKHKNGVGPGPYGPRQDLPGKISQPRRPRPILINTYIYIYYIYTAVYIYFFCLIFLQHIFVILGPSVLGRRDGSIRASRKRRNRDITDNCPLPKPGWATTTATATEEFSQSIQAPSSTHPGISYPVRANPSLRLCDSSRIP